ncbi:protein kinase [Nocardia fusca]|uniref:protein kinase domain-containing protein n=1 Tax=Nocardia fusca TaxID=941183 RepID=UPI0037C9DD2B
MSEDDPSPTVRDVVDPVTEGLAASGLDDAEEIGRGGFGVVYRCIQAELDRAVAVKVLPAELDAESRARFSREQRVMGRLTGHPNIVIILETGVTANGRPYLVMPYHQLGSLDGRIREQGPLPTETVLWMGVKIAGALESAHRLGVLHRDVKPGNILLTDYGEPALTDFGLARITGGFQTAAGALTGSPAFMAPEVLAGEDPTSAADVYGLGATLFCALTGHAAFERRSGENVVTQFLRISTEPVPNLHELGIAEDVAAMIAAAMSREPQRRPTLVALGEALQQAQRHHGFAVDEMALYFEPDGEPRDRMVDAPKWRSPVSVPRQGAGTLPLELTSFVDRRSELAAVKNLLSTARLVTLTGIGGVGKTRLALQAAAAVRGDFADGVWLVELADVSEPALMVNAVATTLGLRDDPARSLSAVVRDFLVSRVSLLVLDNCEHLVEAVAELVDSWLQHCPDLRILVTTRETLGSAGEAILQVPPLAVPEPGQEPSPRGLARYDALTLFADRATAAMPGLQFSDDDKVSVARICARLDGLPLAIELAAARIRTMSPEQILQHLDDRYALLTRGSRTAPRRQQTLRWCIDWSYELCTPAEQRLWARLSIFAGGFELDAAEQVCGADSAAGCLLDVLSSLVDKSILIRDESRGVVRLRLLETVREYGRHRLRESGEEQLLRRRHRDWFKQLAQSADAECISARQPYWFARVQREQSNLRAALEYSLAEDTEQAAEAGLKIAAALYGVWTFLGMYSEGRRWIELLLDHPAQQSIADRVKALQVGCTIAAMQGDLPTAAELAEEGHVLAQQAPIPTTRAPIAYADGTVALYSGDLAAASLSFERAREELGSNRQGFLYGSALTLLGLARDLSGDPRGAIECYQELLSVTEACGEVLFRSAALWGMGLAAWQQGSLAWAMELLENSLRVNRQMSSPFVAALVLEVLCWVHGDQGEAERAAVLMGAAEELQRSMGNPASIFPTSRHHDECLLLARSALGDRRFDAAVHKGRAMVMDEAVAYALGEQPAENMPLAGPGGALTKREQQVADLIAQGLTNKQIAANLVISQRTASGHVERILMKLGFTSRAQIAAWIAERAEQHNQ